MDALIAWFDLHSGTAGWVQATGAIVALFVAIGLAAWQHWTAMKLVTRQRLIATEQLTNAFGAIADAALIDFNAFLDHLIQQEFLVFLCEEFDADEHVRIVRTIDEFPIYQLPSYDCIRAAIEVKQLIHAITRDIRELQQIATGWSAPTGDPIKLDGYVNHIHEYIGQLRGKIQTFATHRNNYLDSQS